MRFSHHKRVSRTAYLCLLLLSIGFFTRVSGQFPSTPRLLVVLEPQPQLTSYFGFYTTLFPVDVRITVHNIGTEIFKGGNMTVHAISPSEKWITIMELRLPRLIPKETFSEIKGFKPEESGLYTIRVIKVTYDSSWISGYEVSGGFLVKNIYPAEFFYYLVFGIIGVILALAGIYSRRGR